MHNARELFVYILSVAKGFINTLKTLCKKIKIEKKSHESITISASLELCSIFTYCIPALTQIFPL